MRFIKLVFGWKFWNSSCSRDNDEWNPTFYAQYIRSHPEKFHNEGLKEELNMASNENLINTYYGNIFMRCVPVLDFLNNRYIELDYQSSDAENLIDKLNVLYKYHHNPISYVYNSLIYYNGKFQTTSNSMVNKSKRKRLFNILKCNFIKLVFFTIKLVIRYQWLESAELASTWFSIIYTFYQKLTT